MPKILIIDDDPHLNTILSKILGKYGFDVTFAADGASGLKKAKAQRPDLIILDIIMPGMDGFEVAKQLQADPTCANIPIMILTAYATPYGRQTAAEAGVDEYVTKPFGVKELVARIQAMTGAAGGAVNGSVRR